MLRRSGSGSFVQRESRMLGLARDVPTTVEEATRIGSTLVEVVTDDEILRNRMRKQDGKSGKKSSEHLPFNRRGGSPGFWH
jgi:hypothetical protein